MDTWIFSVLLDKDVTVYKLTSKLFSQSLMEHSAMHLEGTEHLELLVQAQFRVHSQKVFLLLKYQLLYCVSWYRPQPGYDVDYIDPHVTHMDTK